MFSYLNIRGLIPQTVPSKVPYIRDELYDSSAIAFAVTETWLNNSHLEAELSIDGYSIKRKDRVRRKSKTGRSSGGVAVYVRDDHAISTEILFSYTNGVIESIGLHLMSLNLILIVTYRSPDDHSKTKDGKERTNRHRSTYKEFSAYLKELKKFLSSLPSPSPDIVMMGDYNLPHADWISGQCSSGASTNEQEMVRALYELSLDYFLVQQYDGPTHRDGNTIDLLFTNNTDMVHNVEALPSAVTDHYLMNFSAVYKSGDANAEEQDDPRDQDNAPTSFRSLNFFDEDIKWDALSDDLSEYNWSREFRGLSTAEMMDRFITVCLDITRKWVPSRKHNSTPQTQQKPPKIPKQRRSLMRRRTALKKRYVAARSDASRKSLMQKLVHIEKELQKSYSEQRNLVESRAIGKIKNNPKFFFAFAKRFSKVKIGIGPLIDSAKQLISAPRKIAEILSEQYSSVFSSPRHDNISMDTLFPNNETINTPNLCDINFSDTELADAMEELASNAAPGPDGFPAILLKKCSTALSSPLARIWRTSLRSGEIPPICKSATITPIHKGKSRAVPKNYRPVALTSHLIKIFEKVVRKRIVEFMDDNILFNHSQHGFRGGRSCLSQLLSHFDKITAELEKGNGVDIIYLDFAKAFDKLDHGITLHKLKALGIHGQLGRWIFTFLTNRLQSVVVDGRKSAPKPVLSGVPQGSVLGPLLFLVLIGDIDQNIATAFLSSFADDTRVGNGIASLRDVACLQSDLQTVYKWSVDNNMQFNSDKFELLRYRGSGTKDTQSDTTYRSNDGSIIQEKQHIRDLGITLSNDATFTQHILDRCEVVKSKIAWVLRTFKSRQPTPMLTLWKTLIMCHLDYCSQLWSPSKVGNIQSLELLQKAFIRRIEGMSELSYWDQLKTLKLYSLERRRERYQAIYTWRIIEGQVPNFDCTPISTTRSERRGRTCILPHIPSSAPRRIQSIRFASLTHKGPRLFNCLPREVRDLTNCSTDIFKRALDRFLATLPDEPLVPNMTQYRRCESNSLLDWTTSSYTRDDQRRRNTCTPLHTQDSYSVTAC